MYAFQKTAHLTTNRLRLTLLCKTEKKRNKKEKYLGRMRKEILCNSRKG